MYGLLSRVFRAEEGDYFFVSQVPEHDVDWEYFQVNADTLEVVDKMHEKALTDMVGEGYLVIGGQIISEAHIQDHYSQQ